MLELIDGVRDVAAIIEESGLVEFEAAKALVRAGDGELHPSHRHDDAVWRARAPRSRTTPPREHRELGVALLKTGMFDDAAREFRRALELEPTDVVSRSCLGRNPRPQERLGEC